MSKKKKYSIIVLITMILLIIDQCTKIYISNVNYVQGINGFFSLRFAKNTGGAFGIGQDDTIMFILTNIIVLGLIIRFIKFQISHIDKKTIISLVLVLAGGISNFVDRIFRGYVVDYIDISQFIKFPIFNLADIYIVIGWILLVFSILIYSLKDSKFKKGKNNEE